MKWKLFSTKIVQHLYPDMLKNRFLIFTVCLAGLACSQSDAQREFEDEAFTFPDKITERGADGRPPENGMVDPNDWRIGPHYRGLIEVDPAYPNPVNIDGTLFIQIDFRFSNPISGLNVFVFQDPGQKRFILNLDRNSLSAVEVLNIPPSLFATSVGVGNSPLYRIIVTNENEDIITYGDVEVTR